MYYFFLYFMSFLYGLAGVLHFIKPKVYLKITPKWVPMPQLVNYFVGFLEILFAVGLLFPNYRSYAAIGLMVLLVLIFPANLLHYQKTKNRKKIGLITLIRLPLQLLLILWAYQYV